MKACLTIKANTVYKWDIYSRVLFIYTDNVQAAVFWLYGFFQT